MSTDTPSSTPPDSPESAPDEIKSILVTVKGQSFFCYCGANCFHHPKGRLDRYECNACGEWYAYT